jgi:CRISPR-associated protein Cas6
MRLIEVTFRVLGGALPTDHAYLLYGALSRIVPAFHDPPTRVRFCPIRGQYTGNGRLAMDERSRLRVRLPAEQIATVLPLVGRSLPLGETTLRVGVPQVAALVPAPVLVDVPELGIGSA